MSSLPAKALIASLLILTGCGFQPLYAKKIPGSDKAAMFAGVKVDPVPKSTQLGAEFNDDVRVRQELHSELIDHLNAGAVPPNPTYRLTVTLAESESGIGQSRDGTISRYNVYLESTYTLFRISDGKPVTTGSLRQVGSYSNVIDAYFSTYEARQDAIKRGITELAEQYRARLAAYLTGPDSGKVNETVTTPKDPSTPTFPIIPAPISTSN